MLQAYVFVHLILVCIDTIVLLMALSHYNVLASVCQRMKYFTSYAGIRWISYGYVLYTFQARWHTLAYGLIR